MSSSALTHVFVRRSIATVCLDHPFIARLPAVAEAPPTAATSQRSPHTHPHRQVSVGLCSMPVASCQVRVAGLTVLGVPVPLRLPTALLSRIYGVVRPYWPGRRP